MEYLVARLREFWEKLGLIQKVVVVAIPAGLLVVAAAAIVLVIAAPAVQAPLFRNLDTGDASRIVAELKKNGVDYALENEGQDILVPAAQVYDLRLELAGMGLPQRTVGFELFDKTKLGVTETGMRIDYQRALQGELARTLEALEQVERATVLLNIAPETSFLDTDSHSTASVTLELGSGRGLSASQIEGVRHIVSHAVSRLAPDDVTLVDGSGNPLNGLGDAANGELLASMELTELQHRFRQRVERDKEGKIRDLLEPAYGVGNVSPSVSLEIDFTKLHRESETYTPVVGDQGIEQRVEEHRQTSTSTGEAPGGVPGTTSNIPGYLGIAATETEATESSEYDLMVDYLVNKEVTLEDIPPGAITRRSVAVALSTDTWDANTKASVEGLVASAIGANITAGDNVDVQAFLFADTGAAAITQEYVRQQQARNLNKIIGWIVALMMVVVLALLLRSVVSSALPREALALAAAGRGVPGVEGIDVREGVLAEEFATQRLDQLSDTRQHRMREEIEKLIDRSPEHVVALLRSWMLED